MQIIVINPRMVKSRFNSKYQLLYSPLSRETEIRLKEAQCLNHIPRSHYIMRKKIRKGQKKGGPERRGGRVGRREGVMPDNMNILHKIRINNFFVFCGDAHVSKKRGCRSLLPNTYAWCGNVAKCIQIPHYLDRHFARAHILDSDLREIWFRFECIF